MLSFSISPSCLFLFLLSFFIWSLLCSSSFFLSFSLLPLSFLVSCFLPFFLPDGRAAHAGPLEVQSVLSGLPAFALSFVTVLMLRWVFSEQPISVCGLNCTNRLSRGCGTALVIRACCAPRCGACCCLFPCRAFTILLPLTTTRAQHPPQNYSHTHSTRKHNKSITHLGTHTTRLTHTTHTSQHDTHAQMLTSLFDPLATAYEQRLMGLTKQEAFLFESKLTW
jgi:hypothetical protein